MRTTHLKRRGSAAIEFGLTLPMIVFLLAAVVDWGSYMSLRTSVARAAMDGARRGAAVMEDDTVTTGSLIVPAAETRAELILQEMGLTCTSPDCTVTGTYCAVGQASSNCGSPPLNTVLVTVSYAYNPLFGFVSVPTMITERSVFAIEGQ